MDKRQGRPARLEIGMVVGADAADNIRGGARKGDPAAQAGAGGLYPPLGRFHIVAFRVRGKIIKETFQGVEVSQ